VSAADERVVGECEDALLEGLVERACGLGVPSSPSSRSGRATLSTNSPSPVASRLSPRR